MNGMFPGIFKNETYTNIELTVFREEIEALLETHHLRNVTDKFKRVTDPYVEESKRFGVSFAKRFKNIQISTANNY